MKELRMRRGKKAAMGKKTGMKIGDGDEEEDGEKEEDDPNMGKMRSAGEDTGRKNPVLSRGNRGRPGFVRAQLAWEEEEEVEVEMGQTGRVTAPDTTRHNQSLHWPWG